MEDRYFSVEDRYFSVEYRRNTEWVCYADNISRPIWTLDEAIECLKIMSEGEPRSEWRLFIGAKRKK